jgi:polysaccharide export outer membrane protein
VLGEVTRPGQFAMTTDRVSVFDAIAMAGDLTIFGERDKVRVIRDEKGKQTVVTLDLTKPEVVSSPYFYLRQNDVVYVEPNKAKSSNREMSTLYTFGVSFINLAVGIATLVINIHNMK